MSKHIRFTNACDRCYSAPLATSPTDTSAADGSRGLDRPFTSGLSLRPVGSFGLRSSPGCPHCSHDSPFGLTTSRGHDEVRYRQSSEHSLIRRHSTASLPDHVLNVFGLLSSQFNIHIVSALSCSDRHGQRQLSNNGPSGDSQAREGDTPLRCNEGLKAQVDPATESTMQSSKLPDVVVARSRRTKFIKRLAKSLSTIASVATGQKLELLLVQKEEHAGAKITSSLPPPTKNFYGSGVSEARSQTLSRQGSSNIVEIQRLDNTASLEHFENTQTSSATMFEQHKPADIDTDSVRSAQDTVTEATVSQVSGHVKAKRNLFISTRLECTCSRACDCADYEHTPHGSSLNVQAPSLNRQSISPEAESLRSGPSPSPTPNQSVELIGMIHDRLSSIPPHVRRDFGNGTPTASIISSTSRRISGLSNSTNVPSLSSVGQSASSASVNTVSTATAFRPMSWE